MGNDLLVADTPIVGVRGGPWRLNENLGGGFNGSGSVLMERVVRKGSCELGLPSIVVMRLSWSERESNRLLTRP